MFRSKASIVCLLEKCKRPCYKVVLFHYVVVQSGQVPFGLINEPSIPNRQKSVEKPIIQCYSHGRVDKGFFNNHSMLFTRPSRQGLFQVAKVLLTQWAIWFVMY